MSSVLLKGQKLAEEFRDNACRVVAPGGSEVGFYLKVNEQWYGAYNQFDAQTGKEIFVNMTDGNIVPSEDSAFAALQKFREDVQKSKVNVKDCLTDFGRSSS